MNFFPIILIHLHTIWLHFVMNFLIRSECNIYYIIRFIVSTLNILTQGSLKRNYNFARWCENFDIKFLQKYRRTFIVLTPHHLSHVPPFYYVISILTFIVKTEQTIKTKKYKDMTCTLAFKPKRSLYHSSIFYWNSNLDSIIQHFVVKILGKESNYSLIIHNNISKYIEGITWHLMVS